MIESLKLCFDCLFWMTFIYIKKIKPDDFKVISVSPSQRARRVDDEMCTITGSSIEDAVSSRGCWYLYVPTTHVSVYEYEVTYSSILFAGSPCTEGRNSELEVSEQELEHLL